MRSRSFRRRTRKQLAVGREGSTVGSDADSRKDDAGSQDNGGEYVDGDAADCSGMGQIRGPTGRGPLPASDTKDTAVLAYWLPMLDCTLHIGQVAGDGSTTGSSLWPSSQVLVCFLQCKYDRRRASEKGVLLSPPATAARTVPESHNNTFAGSQPRVLELGAGVGLTSLVLARLGWDVLSTDVVPPLETVLRPNIERNQGSSAAAGVSGRVAVQSLDWTSAADGEAATGPMSSGLASERAFELIVTADTVYEPTLVDGLLGTIATALRCAPNAPPPPLQPSSWQRPQRSRLPNVRAPHALLALERRDSNHIDAALARARNHHGLALQQVPTRTVRRCVDTAMGSSWPRSTWEDVEIWVATSAPG